jgi:hypothetical protein
MSGTANLLLDIHDRFTEFPPFLSDWANLFQTQCQLLVARCKYSHAKFLGLFKASYAFHSFRLI